MRWSAASPLAPFRAPKATNATAGPTAKLRSRSRIVMPWESPPRR